MNRNRIGLQILVSLAVVAGAAANARADFSLVAGNVPQPDENVLLGGNLVGMQIIGSTNQTASAVLFESSSQFLADPSSGQARIEAREAADINAAQVAIDGDIAISLADPSLAFQSLVLNTFIGGGLGAGGDLSFTVFGLDAGGSPISETFGPETIGNGSNFFTLTATAGQLMKSVTINPGANASYADLRQVRIGGIVPEPSSVVLGALLLALTVFGRKALHRRQR